MVENAFFGRVFESVIGSGADITRIESLKSVKQIKLAIRKDGMKKFAENPLVHSTFGNGAGNIILIYLFKGQENRPESNRIARSYKSLLLILREIWYKEPLENVDGQLCFFLNLRRIRLFSFYIGISR